MSIRSGLVLLLVVLFWAQLPATAAEPPPRVRRLAALARLYGEVRHYHPHLPYRDLDWDAVLLATLPAVAAAESTADYAEALGQLLAPLRDPATRVLLPEKEAAAPGCAGAPPLSFAGPVLAVRLCDPALVDDPARMDALSERMRTDLPGARAVLFNLRLPGRPREPTLVTAALESLSGLLVPRPLPAPAQHYLWHAGLRGERGEPPASAFSAYVTEFAGTYTPQADPQGGRPARRRVVFLVNRHSPIPPLAVALQRGDAGYVLSEGPFSDESLIRLRPVPLGEGLSALVRASNLVFVDGTAGPRADLELPAAAPGTAADPAWLRALAVARAVLDPRHKRGRPTTPHLPSLYRVRAAADAPLDLGHRLLGLFRLWTAVRAFGVMAQPGGRVDWDGLLLEYLPRVEAAEGPGEYARALAELLARLPDGQARISGSPELVTQLGPAAPPVALRMVGGMPAISALLDEAATRPAGVALGDVVLAVDSEEVGVRLGRLSRYLAGATPAAQQRALLSRLLRGAEGSTATLLLRGRDGRTKMARLLRRKDLPAAQADEALRTLRQGIVYADLTRLAQAELEGMFTRLRGARGLVLDLRGTVREPSQRLVARLNQKGARLGAVLEQQQILGAEPESLLAQLVTERLQEVEPEQRFGGRVAALVDERTQGEGEQLALLLRAAGVQLIGGTTSGTPGEATQILLPGGLVASFSTVGIREDSGRRVHGQGLAPDIMVPITLSGLQQGRDEVLERAVQALLR